jgi:hypothetical protein
MSSNGNEAAAGSDSRVSGGVVASDAETMISGGSAARVREASIAYDAGRDGGTERGAEPDFFGVARKRCDGRQPRRRGSIWQTGTVAERARPIVLHRPCPSSSSRVCPG